MYNILRFGDFFCLFIRGGSILDSSSIFLKLEGPNLDRLQRALITGDFFVTPPRTIFDLEASLAGTPVAELGEAVERFFAETEIGMLTVTPGDFKTAILDALPDGG